MPARVARDRCFLLAIRNALLDLQASCPPQGIQSAAPWWSEMLSQETIFDVAFHPKDPVGLS